MTNAFLDSIKKIKFYKDFLFNELVQNEKYSYCKNSNIFYYIELALNNIDTNLAIFKHKYINENGKEYFDVEQYSKELYYIYNDLTILYEIIYELSLVEYNKLKAFVDCNLEELKYIAETYKNKAQQEINSTSLGKTLLYKNNNFNQVIKDNCKEIDLGSISVYKSSKIACIVDADEIEANKVVFELYNKDETLVSSAYNYNNDIITIPGENKINTYSYNISKDMIVNDHILMEIDKVNEKNKYVIYGEQNKVRIIEYDDINNSEIVDINIVNNEYKITKKSIIEFFVVDCNKITFEFNKAPLKINNKRWKDINSYEFNINEKYKKFLIECEPGFAFNFNVENGTIFATRKKGIINNNKLYYPFDLDVKNFYIEEYISEEQVNYNAKLKIYNDFEIPIDINSVLIKELTRME